MKKIIACIMIKTIFVTGCGAEESVRYHSIPESNMAEVVQDDTINQY